MTALQDKKVTKKMMVLLASTFYTYNAQQIIMVVVYKLQFQIQFHCYMIAHGITCRNSSMHTVAVAYHAFYKQCLYCMRMHA